MKVASLSQSKKIVFALTAVLIFCCCAKNVSAQTSASVSYVPSTGIASEAGSKVSQMALADVQVDAAPSSASTMPSPTLPNDGTNPNAPGLPDNGTNPNAPNITVIAWGILGGILAALIVIFFLTRKKK